MLDLTQFLESHRKLCVRCYTKHDAERFVNEMIDQYPDKCEYWQRGESKWGEYNTGHVDYFPNFNGIDGDLRWDAHNWAEDNDYFIVDFGDIPEIFEVADLGVFVPADELLDELLT